MTFKATGKRMAISLVLALFASSALSAQLAYKVQVDGLACPFCAYGIEKKLGAVAGVEKIDVDIASGTVNVTMAEGATLDEATAKKAVKEAGFSMRSFKQAPSATPSQPQAPTQ
jgi:mercuric ion binding protein